MQKIFCKIPISELTEIPDEGPKLPPEKMPYSNPVSAMKTEEQNLKPHQRVRSAYAGSQLDN